MGTNVTIAKSAAYSQVDATVAFQEVSPCTKSFDVSFDKDNIRASVLYREILSTETLYAIHRAYREEVAEKDKKFDAIPVGWKSAELGYRHALDELEASGFLSIQSDDFLIKMEAGVRARLEKNMGITDDMLDGLSVGERNRLAGILDIMVKDRLGAQMMRAKNQTATALQHKFGMLN